LQAGPGVGPAFLRPASKNNDLQTSAAWVGIRRRTPGDAPASRVKPFHFLVNKDLGQRRVRKTARRSMASAASVSFAER
jgi:hypothetical protein